MPVNSLWFQNEKYRKSKTSLRSAMIGLGLHKFVLSLTSKGYNFAPRNEQKKMSITQPCIARLCWWKLYFAVCTKF